MLVYQSHHYSPPSQNQQQSSTKASSYLPSSYPPKLSKLIMEPWTWSVAQVGEWLIKHNLQEYIHLLCSTYQMDGMKLINLKEDDVMKLTVPNKTDNKELWYHVKQLQAFRTTCTQNSLKIPITSPSLSHIIPFYNSRTDIQMNKTNTDKQLMLNMNGPQSNSVASNLNTTPTNSVQRSRSQIERSLSDGSLDSGSHALVSATTFTERNITAPVPVTSTVSPIDGHHVRIPTEELEFRDDVSCCILTTLRSDRKKTLYAFLIAVGALMFCSFIITIVDERLPDPKRHPPLPDLILENIPQITWAFTVTEYMIVIDVSALVTVILFHRHRLIILRRLFAIAAVLYFLRSLTMVFTSLPVATVKTDCKPDKLPNIVARLKKTLLIFLGQGLSLYGVRTCGDYLYSGHTCTLILCTHFINEYSPRSYHLLHLLTWLMSLTGMFFILAGHQHYSIDVLIAWILASRLFVYYHTLANNRTLLKRDLKRMRIWFPLFVYFEENVLTAIPNEYCCPTFITDLRTMFGNCIETIRY
ncbi:unnamed protein product [Didymodactylos carnosus]|uniref:SAM domain-containing protein n=1 Tax=Didymodactylos carnosus TaxID=1234261 RepID=A0A813Y4P8_9BILA|nr:unnamed protein product [Didymodactylos carnosus]CAF0881269.1 unnamed protein product [Didymodactylos carnosus]CAF3662374.1 unnamed protein product [Didymodactylos carnosus]CAF3664925.1 unnamed protein product [Didymodactylos carnosus]